MSEKVTIYTLSTCGHCKAAKQFLTEQGVAYTYKDVDLLSGDERTQTIAEVKKHNASCSFPTILVGDKVIVGFNEYALRETLNL
jgi:glutaredoxin